ncbi:hypothetical protein JHL17_29560 [Azospirillum sp. YIM B02556]|uniref:Uncharacterized protein n=1 Tax=Azospirillum endophyticum TaxID=2800326 RepID=A0ABS1FDP9_9PROT|nr:hypothetical protein [Azospirillum endophyticum]MBK1841556.1 hypothetical protein [Azospirillum endophyticum]
MLIDTTDPIRDAFETIRATDVISDAKKHVLYRGLEMLRRQHCPETQRPTDTCEDCLSHRRCLTAVVDLLGS